MPFDGGKDRFRIVVSDGTLIAGGNDPDEERFHLQVEGVGIARISTDEVTRDWRAEWITIAPYRPKAVGRAQPHPMPLFEWPGGPDLAPAG